MKNMTSDSFSAWPPKKLWQENFFLLFNREKPWTGQSSCGWTLLLSWVNRGCGDDRKWGTDTLRHIKYQTNENFRGIFDPSIKIEYIFLGIFPCFFQLFLCGKCPQRCRTVHNITLTQKDIYCCTRTPDIRHFYCFYWWPIFYILQHGSFIW